MAGWGGRLKIWTAEELVELRRFARMIAPLLDIERLSRVFGCDRAEVDRALGALLGRSAPEAAAWLAANPPPPSWLHRVIERSLPYAYPETERAFA